MLLKIQGILIEVFHGSSQKLQLMIALYKNHEFMLRQLY